MKNKTKPTRINAKDNNTDKSTAKLERERKNYSDYLYQNTAEVNISAFNEKPSLDEKEKFLHDALSSNEQQKLVEIETFDRYNLVVNRIVENYDKLDKTNSSLTIDDLCVQTHLILLPDKFINPTEIKEIISRALESTWSHVNNGKVIMFNNKLLFDSLKFQDKIIPICAVNAKLIPPKYIVNFSSLEPESYMDIMVAFSKILENALNSRFYVKLDKDIIVLRKGKENEEQNQLFISEKSLKKNFTNIKTRERSKEIYDEINLEDVVSNKTSGVISFEKTEVNKSKKGKKRIVTTKTKKSGTDVDVEINGLLKDSIDALFSEELSADEKDSKKKKSTTKKAPAKKSTTTKKASAKKSTTTKKAPAKKSTTKKASAKKSTSKAKTPVKKVTKSKSIRTKDENTKE